MNTTDIRNYFADLRKKRLGIVSVFLLCAIAFAVIAAIQCYFLNTQYEIRYDLYLYGSIAPSFLFWSLSAVCLAVLALTFAFPKESFQEEVSAPLASQRALFLCLGFGHLFLLGYLLLSSARVFDSLLITILTVLFTLGCAAYGLFSSELFLRHRQSSPYFGITTQLIAILFWLLRIFALYFDRTTPMTSPLKTLEMTVGFFLCFYLICNIRKTIGTPLPRLQWAVKGIAFLLSAVFSVSRLYLLVLEPQSFSVNTVFGLLALLWAAVIGVELWQACVTRLLHRYTDYLIFGVLTTAVNFLCYFLLTRLLQTPVLTANIVAFVFSVLFAYTVNKFFVFEAKRRHTKDLLIEGGSFFLSRMATLGLEELILYVFVYLLACNDLITKIIAAVIVVVTNYFTGRFLVFKNAKETAKKST